MLRSPAAILRLPRWTPAQIQQVLTNLIVNAIQAMPGGGKVDIHVRRQAARDPGSGDDRQ